MLLCHDGFTFIQVVFSKEAWTGLSTYLKNEKMCLSDMPKYRLSIAECSFHLRKVPSSEVFTSYAGLEVRLIITDPNVKVLGGQTQFKSQFAKSIFRDDEVKCLLLKKYHEAMQKFALSTVPNPLFEGDSVVKQNDNELALFQCFEIDDPNEATLMDGCRIII